ncbi:probable integral outer membrane protein [unidentified eubacterium SCB49]|nr:probable integral outer membrane protein [unidentified eubacterium SCB49]
MFQSIANTIQSQSKLILTLAGLGCITFSPQAIAQEEEQDLGTEVVNVVKPYTPTISDAFKVKQTPVLNDDANTAKKPVRYQIFSVPVASTFTPAKSKASGIKKIKAPKSWDNYATLGFGNNTTILAELFSNFEISRTENAGVYLRHNSSQRGIDGLAIDNKYYDTRLDGNYYNRQRDMSYGIEAGVEHQIYNWYGSHFNEMAEAISYSFPEDVNQSYLSAYAGGNIAFDDSYFKKATATLRYTGDAFSTSEINFRAQPEFSFPVSDLNFKVLADIDYLSGRFEQGISSTDEIKYSFLNAGLSPSLVYSDNDLTANIGVTGYVSLDTNASETNFNIYPNINASYNLLDELLVVYAGAEGGLEQNTYYQLKNDNPFISPTQQIKPSSKLYEGFGGVKGKLSSVIAYNLRGSYSNTNDQVLFTRNAIDNLYFVDQPYQQANSFSAIYDDIKTLNIFGELQVEVSENFAIGGQVNFNSYTLESQVEAWNLPKIDATLFTRFNITEKLYGGGSIFFVGEREALVSYFNDIYAPEKTTLDSYLDLNANLGYRISDRLNVFAKGSNLLAKNYEKWLDYPVQGIQVLGGATYKFDW